MHIAWAGALPKQALRASAAKVKDLDEARNSVVEAQAERCRNPGAPYLASFKMVLG